MTHPIISGTSEIKYGSLHWRPVGNDVLHKFTKARQVFPLPCATSGSFLGYAVHVRTRGAAIRMPDNVVETLGARRAGVS